jgi:hypothetical protein
MNFNLLFGRRVQANASYPDTSFLNIESSSDPPQDLGNTLLDRKIHRALCTQYDTAFLIQKSHESTKSILQPPK